MPQFAFVGRGLALLMPVVVCCEVLNIDKFSRRWSPACIHRFGVVICCHTSIEDSVGRLDPRNTLQHSNVPHGSLSPDLRQRPQAAILWLRAVRPLKFVFEVCLSHTPTRASMASPVRHLTSAAVHRCGKPSVGATRRCERL